MNLRELIQSYDSRNSAIGHFNISDTIALKAIFEAARELNLPVLIGTSEGERDFLGARQAVALIRSLREEFDYPIFLNADHTHSLEKVKEAVEAGYDAILFDGGKLPLEENILRTREVVEYVKSINPEIIIEGELGYIGSSSDVLKEVPEGAATQAEDLTSPEDAKRFVEETGVDLLAPAVGNIHGMIINTPNPKLDMVRIKKIKEAAGVPLVLHGGSGTSNEEFRMAIDAGISIIHINTELRMAWRKGLESSLLGNKDTVSPYKLYAASKELMKELIQDKLRVFEG